MINNSVPLQSFEMYEPEDSQLPADWSQEDTFLTQPLFTSSETEIWTDNTFPSILAFNENEKSEENTIRADNQWSSESSTFSTAQSQNNLLGTN